MIGYELNYIDPSIGYCDSSDIIFEGQSDDDWRDWLKLVTLDIKEALKENLIINFIMNEYYGDLNVYELSTTMEIIPIKSIQQFVELWNPKLQDFITEEIN